MTQIEAILAFFPRLFALTILIFGEARSESYEGKKAVAYSVMNRLKAKSWYGDSLTEIIFKKSQFSCFWVKDQNYETLLQLTDINLSGLSTEDYKAYVESQRAALEVLEDEELIHDPTHGATHYHVSSRVDIRKRWTDRWGFEQTIQIDNHIFYKGY